jgi:hypothetical protein
MWQNTAPSLQDALKEFRKVIDRLKYTVPIPDFIVR